MLIKFNIFRLEKEIYYLFWFGFLMVFKLMLIFVYLKKILDNVNKSVFNKCNKILMFYFFRGVGE